ncbi:thiamine pyrophosphate-binding protein [Actinoplanes siamensis]|uniref:Acetolactate synthase I/II/III large subunit n=1 Tax=Actinoplanes siamensis TaxID=1223317 RepID=A0A919N9J9_9ACTN|nr:thiamine pyrophosphate-binding protein [Actinoplanes siamensis]GIF07047.1 acetolactate synthase I/II/III large subunit [Actinoplanes siamensis]
MTAFPDAIGGTLARSGVRYAFGLVGGGNILTVAGLTRAGIRYVPARHEAGAMAMADAYHRVSGEVAICTTSHGAGLTNAATALAEAVKHGSGALVVCGDAPLAGRRPHDVDQAAFAASLGARVLRITDPASAMRTVAAALRLARAGSRPVVLCVPGEIVAADVPDAAPADVAPAGELTAPGGHETVAGPELAAVADAIALARRPVLLAGAGAWRGGATKAILDLGERLGALYATTVMASGLFAGHPWCLGVFGGFAPPAAAELIRDADLIIAFGASLDPFTLHHGLLVHPAATLVQVNTAAGDPPARADLTVRADAAAAASALRDELDARGVPACHWRDSLASRKDPPAGQHPDDDGRADGRIDPRTLTAALARLLPVERTVVLDGGQFIEWPIRHWPVPDPAGLAFMGAAFQTIGLGLAGAVGAAAGRPDRLTVAAVGDGGALMGLPELETLVRTGASALVVVYDDAAFGFEVHMYGPRGADLRTASFADTDFAGIARALGAAAQTVREIADLRVVRSWSARGCPGVLLLDCKVSRDVVAGFLSELIAGR